MRLKLNASTTSARFCQKVNTRTISDKAQGQTNQNNQTNKSATGGAQLNRESYMSAHVLLNLLNESGKRDKMRGLPSISSLFRNEFNKFNNTRARMLDSIYHMSFKLVKKSHFCVKTSRFCHIYATL